MQLLKSILCKYFLLKQGLLYSSIDDNDDEELLELDDELSFALLRLYLFLSNKLLTLLLSINVGCRILISNLCLTFFPTLLIMSLNVPESIIDEGIRIE